jgi:hypothetical protein
MGTLDNFLRPVLIRQGADLPLLLIFAGGSAVSCPSASSASSSDPSCWP